MTKWKLVPVEPTPDMQAVAQSVAAFAGINIYLEDAREIYSVMLEVAPQPPKLSDDVICDLMTKVIIGEYDILYGSSDRENQVMRFARAIEREILGGEYD